MMFRPGFLSRIGTAATKEVSSSNRSCPYCGSPIHRSLSSVFRGEGCENEQCLNYWKSRNPQPPVERSGGQIR